MKTAKRLTQIVLALALVIVCTIVLAPKVEAAVAKQGTCGDNLNWVLEDNGTLTISGTGRMKDCTYHFPMNWTSLSPKIKRVIIEEGVTYIGDYAFYDLGSGGFYDEIVSVTIPSTVTEIGDHAFTNMRGLEGVYICNLSAWCNIQFGSGANPLENEVPLYLNGTQVKNLVIPNNVTSISARAFYYCTSIETVTIPASVKSIGKGAFSGCENLERIRFLGNAPSVTGSIFSVTTLALYPRGNSTWTTEAKNACRSYATWLEYESWNTGWIQVYRKWYYYKNRVKQTGWLLDGGKWYYLDRSGVMQTGWVMDSSKWYYMNGSGAMQTGWIQDNGKWYYMNKSGAMVTGWLLDGGKWYYLNRSGEMMTGWLQEGESRYYLSNSGAMVTGNRIIDGEYHSFNGSGVWIGKLDIQLNGWIQESGKWYYYIDSVKQIGWLELGNTKYYLDNSGVMVTGEYSIDGELHNFSASGAWLGEVQPMPKNGWVKEYGWWRYYQNDVPTRGWKQIGGVWYFFDAGYNMQTGWIHTSSKWYYLEPSGAMVTGTRVIDGITYHFDSSGAWIP